MVQILYFAEKKLQQGGNQTPQSTCFLFSPGPGIRQGLRIIGSCLTGGVGNGQSVPGYTEPARGWLDHALGPPTAVILGA